MQYFNNCRTNDTDAMEIGVGFDALNSSKKRVKRSSKGNDSVKSSSRKDDLVEANDASVSDLGMLPWKPMNGLRCKVGRAAKGNRNSIVTQKRAGNESGKKEVISSPDVGSSLPYQRRYMKNKGKVNLEDHTLKDVQHGESTNLSSRAALFGKEVVTVADEQGSFESYENFGLQKTKDFKINMKQLSHTNSRNNKEKLSSSYLPEGMHETDIEDKGNANVIGKCPQITTQGHISNPHRDQAFPDPVVSKRNRSCKKTAKGKSKCNSLSSNFGETSVSASHAGISNLNQEMSNENGFYGTALIEIDELYPEARYCVFFGQSGVFDISSAIADQIESDEIFARELQEEFDHETPRVIRMDMVDAAIACSLQQDEDEDEYAATLSENDRSNSGDATVAWSLQQDEDEDADALPQNDRSKYERIDEIRGKLRYEANLEKRFDLYQEWEDLLENSDTRENDDLASNHCINNTENAMQFYSDDSDDQRVDSSVINNLPLILIQNNNGKEACAVCLEIPAVGETMRYLPCLHKFHKMCIDTWLKIKPACPVCKFKLTLS